MCLDDILSLSLSLSLTSEGRDSLIRLKLLNQCLDHLLRCSLSADNTTHTNETSNTDVQSIQRLTAFKIIRNSCINSQQNANFIGQNYPNLFNMTIFSHCKSFMQCRSLTQSGVSHHEDSHQNDNDSRLILVISQFLSNFASNKTKFIHLLWCNSQSSSSMSDVMAMAITCGNREALSACIATVYNSLIHTNSTSLQSDESLIDITSTILDNRQIFCQMLLSVMDLHVMSMKSTETTSSDSNPVMEWLQILVLWLITEGHIINVFNLVGNMSSPNVLNHEQVSDTVYELHIYISLLWHVYQYVANGNACRSY